jgi:hypothetical protein
MKKFIVLSVFVLNMLFCAANTPIEQASEIIRSRIEYYNDRAKLLTGDDPASLAFQAEQNESRFTMTSNMGVEGVLALLSGSVSKLDLVRRSNSTFQEQWVAVAKKLKSICSGKGKISDLDIFKLIFGSRRGGASREMPAAVAADTQRICDEVNDFEQVLALVTDFKESQNRLAERYVNDLDGLVAEIEGTGAPVKKKKKRKKKKKVVATGPVVSEPKEESDNEGPSIMQPSVVGNNGLDVAIQESAAQDFPLVPISAVEYASMREVGLSILPTPPLREKKEAKEGKEKDAHDLPHSKAYQIKRKNFDHLRSLLGARDVPIPNWAQATSAVNALMKHTGGYIDGTLGNGSETAFWVGNHRFIVDAQHGKKKGEPLTYDRLYFFKSGLNRAGITLESIY